ncbi:MAG: homoserine dehydrogenase [Phycisphaerales bacterium]|nr:homoserine dehydrogenase [Phycisphaerales bacterium]
MTHRHRHDRLRDRRLGAWSKLLLEQSDLYAKRLGRRLELRRVLVREKDLHYRTEQVPKAALTTDAEVFFATPDMPIMIELGGGRGAISQFVRRAIGMGKHVVTANKALVSAEGPELLALARKHNVALAFEASCCGGIPVINALNFGLMANDIRALYGILNGTCNYILTEMTCAGKSYATALSEAQQKGYAEADPTLDVSGRDAAHKLAILAALAFGVQVTEDKVRSTGIDELDLADVQFGMELGYTIKLLGIAENVPGKGLLLSVQPCFVHQKELIAQVQGSFNALSVFGHAVGHTLSYGRGAGQMPTASAVLADVLNIAAGWYPQAFTGMNLWPDTQPMAVIVDPDDLVSRFYVRIKALDKPGTMARVTAVLGEAGISLSAVRQHEVAADSFVPVVVTTHAARYGALRSALAAIAKLDVIEGQPVCIRIVDMPVG